MITCALVFHTGLSLCFANIRNNNRYLVMTWKTVGNKTETITTRNTAKDANFL